MGTAYGGSCVPGMEDGSDGIATERVSFRGSGFGSEHKVNFCTAPREPSDRIDG